ncbi:MAG TPA: hypothetical protein VLA54_11125 [Acidimicrobiia bacterium]|nr:hypothetical protein [Acidimicrobiia bacterium]
MKVVTGLKPRGFTWVIADRLAVSERIGGSGFQHRKIRREEEISWLKRDAGITSVITLLPGNQNLQAYRDAGLAVSQVAVAAEPTKSEADHVFKALHKALGEEGARVLLHREVIDDNLGGILAGYLVWSGMVAEPIMAVALVQEILKRPLGPEGRSLVPNKA